jgi:hypothetical protein
MQQPLVALRRQLGPHGVNEDLVGVWWKTFCQAGVAEAIRQLDLVLLKSPVEDVNDLVGLVGEPHEADGVLDGGTTVGCGSGAAPLSVEVQDRLNLVEDCEEQSPADPGCSACPIEVEVEIRGDQLPAALARRWALVRS